jgi:peroxiredoxin
MSLAFVFACSSSHRISSSPVSGEKTSYISAIDNYFENMIPQIPDSIIHAIDIVLPKAENDTAMMKFLTKHIFNKYLHFIDDSSDTKITGIENVIIHIIDNYYLAGRVMNVNDEKFLTEITEYANKNRETLTGKQAENLKMETINGGAESLYDIDSPYVLVCFFDVSCSHCRNEIPKIYKIFQKFKDEGLAGFCVYTRNDKKEWLEFVSKYKLTDWINVWDPVNNNDFRVKYSVYSVPQVYVLDKDMKIAGRGLESKYLEHFLNNLIKR